MPNPLADIPVFPAIYTVRKQCYLCQRVWEGSSFVPHPPEAKPLPGTCPDCLAKEDTAYQRLVKGGSAVTESGVPVVNMTDLKIPRRTSRPGDD